MERPLIILIYLVFKKLRSEKTIISPYLKEFSLKDLLHAATGTISSSFSESSTSDYFSSTGILDIKIKRYADLHRIVNSFKINWGKVKGGKQWFVRILPAVLSEMFSQGNVCETFYDDNNCTLECDHEGDT